MGKKSFWVKLCLVNLAIVALLGLLLRSKILFSIPQLNFRYVLSAHSHFAFGGWVALILITLLIYDVLPSPYKEKRSYQVALWGIFLTSIGMAFTFPFMGYRVISIIFSSSFILFTFYFSWIFFFDLLKAKMNKTIKLLGIFAILVMVFSSLGPLTLAWILATGSTNNYLYRDAVYFFLHFQYNGFFTLVVMALFINSIAGSATEKIQRNLHWFAVFLCASIFPSFFLSVLWHPNNEVFLVLALIGCILILITLYWFFRLLPFFNQMIKGQSILPISIIGFACTAFILKMFFQMGTIIPGLDTAVYANRPLIIGFLHMVFLGLVTFYVLYHLLQNHLLDLNSLFTRFSISVFGIGIVANVSILMFQGLGILLKITSTIFPILLWLAAIILFIGALMLVVAAYKPKQELTQMSI